MKQELKQISMKGLITFMTLSILLFALSFGLCPKNCDLKRPGCEGGEISE